MDGRVNVDYRPENLKELHRMLAAAAKGKSPQTLVLALDHLNSLDVAGLRGLIALLREARSSGVDLVLRTSKPGIRRVLAVTALDRLFRIESGEDAAA